VPTRSVSKLTSKYQTTVPAPVRRALDLGKGDTIVFETEDDGTVTLRKARGIDLEFAAALEPLLSEWDSAEDEEAYRDLP
jgi:antitoxin PrlF